MKKVLPAALLVARALLAAAALGAIVRGCYLLHPSLAYIVGGALVWSELRTRPDRGGGGPAA